MVASSKEVLLTFLEGRENDHQRSLQSLSSNYLFQIRKLHMLLFKLEMIQANNKLFYTEKIIQLNLTLLNYLKYYML